MGNNRTTTVDAACAHCVSFREYYPVGYLWTRRIGQPHFLTLTDTSTYGGAKTQTRSFIYSSLGRLVSATNPEADAATSYTYYADGARHTQTDARGMTITYITRSMDWTAC